MAPKTDTRLIDAAAIKRAERITEAVEAIDKRREEYRKDACFITEIIRDMVKSGIHLSRADKFGCMLFDWQKELMEKAGFETMDELKKYFFKHVGEENW